MTIHQLADAAAAGGAEAVRRLLDEVPTLATQYTDEGWTALHLAATAEIAAILLDAGADINARNRHKFAGPGNSPLSAAVYQDRRDVVRLLIDRGADVNQGDNAGFTPLHLAVALGRIEAAGILLESGADANARTNMTGGKQWANKTPLDLLAVEDRTGEGGSKISAEVDAEIASLLRKHGARS
jgi:uncharacterized protein